MAAKTSAEQRATRTPGGVPGNSGRRYRVRAVLVEDFGRIVELARFSPAGAHLPSLTERLPVAHAVALGMRMIEAAALTEVKTEPPRIPTRFLTITNRGLAATPAPGGSGLVRLRVYTPRRTALNSLAESFRPQDARALGGSLISVALDGREV